MTFKVDVDGLEDIEKTIRQMMRSMEPAQVEPVFLAGAEIITQEVRTRIRAQTNRRTGALADSAVTKLLKRKGNLPAPAISAIDTRKAPHAHFMEKGTKQRRGRGRVRARPFFKPAVVAKGEVALRFVVKELEGKIARAML